MANDLTDVPALAAGSAKGSGRATSERLQASGASARSMELLPVTIDGATGGQVDATQPAKIAAAAAAWAQTTHLGVRANCASDPGPVFDTSGTWARH